MVPETITGVSIRQRVYPRGEQIAALTMHCDHARYIYNLGLEHRKLAYRHKLSYGHHPGYRDRHTGYSYVSQAAMLTAARAEFDWLREGSTVVQQGALRDLDRAFTNFFEKRASYPTFRSGRAPRQGFVVRDVTVVKLNKNWAAISVPKVGKVRFRLSRPWEAVKVATGARITFHNNQWHVALTTPPRGKINAEATAGHIGIDRGVKNTIVTSDSEFFQAPGLTDGECRRFIALERKLARQRKGSRNREATKAKLSVLRQRLGNRRCEWIEQTTTELALRHSSIALEKLPVRNMVRRPKPKPDPDNPGNYLPNGASAKAALNKAILASCWGKFAERLSHKTDVIEVSARYTSQQCHSCGHIDERNRESQAEFCCVNCGNSGHADVHAAMNIDERAFGELTTCRRTGGLRATETSAANQQAA